MRAGQCYIGTSGWRYAHWAKGRVYPKGMKQGDWLGFFARHFGTVEINMSFYRLPKTDMIVRWRERVGSRFRFAVKLWRRITHEKRLANCTREMQDFLTVTAGLRAKRGPLLVQLPPSMRKDLGLLEAFLADLKHARGRSRLRVTVEFRSTDWLCDPVYELLDDRGVAVCLADLERCPITEPNDVDFVYIRRHGPGGRYRGCYAARHIADDADRIRAWRAAGKDVYVYFNNDAEGYAVDNARELLAAVGAD